MKSKPNLTRQEYEAIIQLINEKLNADDSRQRVIRQKIRDIGFYFEDFYTRSTKYNVDAFLNVINSGKIKIVD